MSKHTHSPAPWDILVNVGECVIGSADRMVCECYDDGEPQDATDEANAAHIVRCVNSHDDLLAALEGLLYGGEDVDQEMTPEADRFMALYKPGTLAKARAAISRAKG